MDVLLTLVWRVDRPARRTVELSIHGFTAWLSVRLFEAYIQLCSDIYSKNSYTRSVRATATHFHQFNLKPLLPAHDALLKNTANKTKLNTLICESILLAEEFLNIVTWYHKLKATGDKTLLVQVPKRCKTPRLDLHRHAKRADVATTQTTLQKRSRITSSGDVWTAITPSSLLCYSISTLAWYLSLPWRSSRQS